MPDIGLLINPNALKNRIFGRLRYEDRASKDVLIIQTATAEELPSAVQRLVDARVRLLGISGGDGTFHAVFTEAIPAFLKAGIPLPHFLPLRDGTMCNLSHSVGIQGDMVEYFASSCRAFREGTYLSNRRWLLKMNQFYGFIIGLGAGARIVEAYYDAEGLGPVRAAKLTAQVVAAILFSKASAKTFFAPVNMTLSTNGCAAQHELNGMLAGTLKQTGFGFRFLSRAHEKEGYFHFLATRMPPLRLVGFIPRLYQGRHMPQRDDVLDLLLQKVDMTFARPEVYMIDGEMYPAIDRITLEMGPALDVLTVAL